MQNVVATQPPPVATGKPPAVTNKPPVATGKPAATTQDAVTTAATPACVKGTKGCSARTAKCTAGMAVLATSEASRLGVEICAELAVLQVHVMTIWSVWSAMAIRFENVPVSNAL